MTSHRSDAVTNVSSTCENQVELADMRLCPNKHKISFREDDENELKDKSGSSYVPYGGEMPAGEHDICAMTTDKNFFFVWFMALFKKSASLRFILKSREEFLLHRNVSR